MTSRISSETFAMRASRITADLRVTEGEAVMRFRHRRAINRERPEPDKTTRKRNHHAEVRQCGL